MVELYKDSEQPIPEPIVVESGQPINKPKITGGEINGAYYTSGGTNSERIDIFPSYDKSIGIVQYNAAGDVTLKTILAGDGAGDIYVGDYAGGMGMFWDNSEGKLNITGALTTGVGSTINGTYVDELNVSKLRAGTITAQAITLAAGTGSCYINSGKTLFDNTQAGFILGVDSSDSKAKFYIGDTSNYLNWNGSALSVAGSISATSGTIGGFTISATNLLAGTGPTRIQLDTASGIHLGHDTFASAPFSVSLAGALKATSGTIANWNISSTALSTGNYQENGKMYFGASGLSLSDVFSVDNAGALAATSGTIAGWEMQTDLLRSASSGARIELNKTKSRVSIFDAVNEKVAMGYLNGLAKNDGTGNWGAGDYGFWAASGDMLSIDGDGEYTSGDWIVRHDAAYLINDASGNTIVRLGTDSGDKGLFIYDTLGTQLAKYVSDEIFIGEATKYLQYTAAGGLKVMGEIAATSGKFGSASNYWSIGSTGITAVAADGDVVIKHGKADFGQDSTSGFILGYDYSATKSKFEIGSSATKIFKYDGTDLSLIGGTITGGVVQTGTTGKRVVIQSGTGTYDNSIKLYDSSGNENISIASVATALLTLQAYTSGQALNISNNSSVTQMAPLASVVTNNSSSTGSCLELDNAGSGNCLNINPGYGKGLYISSTTDSNTSPSLDIASDSYGLSLKMVKTLSSVGHASNENGIMYMYHSVGSSTYRSTSSTVKILNDNGGDAMYIENMYSSSGYSTIRALGANPTAPILSLIPTNYTSSGWGGSFAKIIQFASIASLYIGTDDPNLRLTGTSAGDLCITASGLYRYVSGTIWNLIG